MRWENKAMAGRQLISDPASEDKRGPGEHSYVFRVEVEKPRRRRGGGEKFGGERIETGGGEG